MCMAPTHRWDRVIGRRAGPSLTVSNAIPVHPQATEARPMDAITLLKTDHDKVKTLLEELESTTERGVKTRAELFSTIKGELTVHEIIEEEIFYPELKAHPKAKDIVLE